MRRRAHAAPHGPDGPRKSPPQPTAFFEQGKSNPAETLELCHASGMLSEGTGPRYVRSYVLASPSPSHFTPISARPFVLQRTCGYVMTGPSCRKSCIEPSHPARILRIALIFSATVRLKYLALPLTGLTPIPSQCRTPPSSWNIPSLAHSLRETSRPSPIRFRSGYC